MTVTVSPAPPPPPPDPLPSVRTAWLNSQVPAVLRVPLAHSGCMAKVPVGSTRSADFAPGPAFHSHRSAFSSPAESVHPPGGFWSVIVSAYSWPPTIEKPSSRPACPPLTKFSPHARPASVTYGRFVNAMSPYGEVTGPPGNVESPFQSCQPQKLPDDVLNPSGCVPVGDRIRYWAFLLACAVSLPK